MKRWFIFLIPAIIAVLLDLISKSWFFDYLNNNGNICLVENFLYLTKAYNKGVAFGLLQKLHILLLFFIPLIIIGLAIYIHINKLLPTIQVFLFGLILGGAIGNYYDRLFIENGVRDFIDVKLFSYDFPVFNIADAFISCSVFVLFILSFFQKDPPNTKET